MTLVPINPEQGAHLGFKGFSDPRKKIFRLLPTLIAVITLLCAAPQVWAADNPCAPASVTLCINADDGSGVWINGHFIASYPGSTDSPNCIPIPADDFVPGANNIAVSVNNLNAGYGWGSWNLKIGCSGGNMVQETSLGDGVKMYNYIPAQYVTILSPFPSNAVSILPPTDASGNEWFQPGYATSAKWTRPVQIDNRKAVWYLPVTVNGEAAWIGADACAESGNQTSGICDDSHSPRYEAPARQNLFFIQNFTLLAPAATPTGTPTHIPTNTPTRPPAPTRTFTPLPRPTATPIPTPTPRPRPLWKPTPRPLLPTPTPRPLLRKPTPTPLPLRRVKLIKPKPTPTFRVFPTNTPLPVRHLKPQPTPLPRKVNPTPTFTVQPVSVESLPQTVVFTNPPVNILISFMDGPGKYKVELVDSKRNHIQTLFEKRVTFDKETWLSWDGKNEDGKLMPQGHYSAIFSKDGKILRYIALDWITPSP
jgi:hypothetical protein